MTGSGADSTSRYPSASPRRMSPVRSVLPVGRANATSRPFSVTTRFRLQRRSSQVSLSTSRSLPARAPGSTCTWDALTTFMSEQEIALGHGEGPRRLAGEQLAVGADLVGQIRKTHL